MKPNHSAEVIGVAKSANQKLKLLYLQKILLEETDDAHCIALPELIRALQELGIAAERKSLYTDLEALRQFGLDVEFRRGKNGGYYIAERPFQLPELKLLVDSVQASRFITQRKSSELIRKIESLASVHEAKQLHRQVYAASRVKTMNESIYYNVDKIYVAISNKTQITFRYFAYTVKKEKRYRHGGLRYQVSPFALSWDNENYYMLAFDRAAQKLKHYRVDKMESIAVTRQKQEGAEVFQKIDMAAYSQRVFSMYGGEDVLVRLRFAARLIGVVMDRFGKDVRVFPVPSGTEEPKWFEISVHVELSPQFYGWMASFGGEAQVLAPEKAVNGMQAQLRAALEAYGAASNS